MHHTQKTAKPCLLTRFIDTAIQVGNAGNEGSTMKKMLSTITRKGQVTIPAPIRKAWGIGPRDRVACKMQGDRAIVRPAPSSLLEGFGAVAPGQRPEDFGRIREEIERAIAEEASGEG